MYSTTVQTESYPYAFIKPNQCLTCVHQSVPHFRMSLKRFVAQWFKAAMYARYFSDFRSNIFTSYFLKNYVNTYIIQVFVATFPSLTKYHTLSNKTAKSSPLRSIIKWQHFKNITPIPLISHQEHYAYSSHN